MRAFAEVQVVVPNGGTVSSPVPIKDADSIALSVPVITSGALLLEVSHDTTSANFLGVHAVNSGGAFNHPAGIGGFGINVTQLVAGFAYMRVKTQNAQGADRTFRLYVRR